MVSAECMVFLHLRDVRKVVQCTGDAYQRGAPVKSNTTPKPCYRAQDQCDDDNATVQQPLTKVSPNSNPTVVQIEVGFVSKPNVAPCPPFIAPLAVQMPVVSSQG
ncbi:hypothetical protein TNCV_1082951 [Trichonephila clavipes]|nr:hypothetical protein TNCV_1082951 [Trichonephila clavipes]